MIEEKKKQKAVVGSRWCKKLFFFSSDMLWSKLKMDISLALTDVSPFLLPLSRLYHDYIPEEFLYRGKILTTHQCPHPQPQEVAKSIITLHFRPKQKPPELMSCKEAVPLNLCGNRNWLALLVCAEIFCDICFLALCNILPQIILFVRSQYCISVNVYCST